MTDKMTDKTTVKHIGLSIVDQAVAKIGSNSSATISLLQALQNAYGYLPPAALERLCELTDLTPAKITGVSTFYEQFRHTPAGKHRVKVCHGTACHVKDAPGITDAIRKYLHLSDEDDTDDTGLFTVEKVACLGCCTLAPAVQIDDVIYGYLTGDTVGVMLEDFLASQHETKLKPKPLAKTSPPVGEIRVSLGSCCIAQGAGKIFDEARRIVDKFGVNVVVKRVGCEGICYLDPIMKIIAEGKDSTTYANVDCDDVQKIITKHFKPKGLVKKIAHRLSSAVDKLLTDESWTPVSKFAVDYRDQSIHAFRSRQQHIATEGCGEIDPLDIDAYIASGGFESLGSIGKKYSPRQIIDTIHASGLRGRGGGGFLTGLKWELVAKAPADKKYVVCNCDEGDPGAFMDRMLLESCPFRVIEGAMISARAVGADEVILYIRAEYPLAVTRAADSLAICVERGVLANDLVIKIAEGAGAFVCGEETALIKAIEGKRATPRLRPPYPSSEGLRKKPTLVNNAETLACIPWIIRQGPAAFASLGSDSSKGTKVFALAGKVRRGGLIEVPMGITLREIVEEIGGGVPGGKKLKAVQVGGPSGGCVPEALCDTPVDYDALSTCGAMMGSGGLVVLDEDDCMVEIARYFLEFTREQSCGRCTFCRIGTKRMLDIIERLCKGLAKSSDIDELEKLAAMVSAGSLCGLGRTAPNPALSTLTYFRSEYDAHVAGQCPALKCRDLITFAITDDCVGCTLCAQACPTGAITIKPYQKHEIDSEKCVRCGSCKNTCPNDAIIITSP